MRAEGFGLRVVATDGLARRARIDTPHGPIETPTFMPVATFGAVRGIGNAELAAADYGPAPFGWEQKAREFLTSQYADKGVFQVKLREPQQAWYGARGGIGRMRDVRYGWAVGFRAFRLGFAALDSEVARGEVFFRDDAIDAIADQNGLVFVGR